MSSMSIQYQLPEKGASLAKATVPRPTPGADEVCFRTKAIGLNPLDWKIRVSGIMVQSWPAVLGVDAAGVIDSVGENVKGFKAGDEVFALCGFAPKAGAYQELVTVPVNQVAKKPASLSFEEAATLPIVYLTAAAVILNGLHIPLPHLDPAGGSALKSVLVLGGSSGVGASAIQMLRMALPDATILATSSAAHHEHLRALGADKCFERSAQEDPSVIRAATPGGAGVDAILDSVAAGAGQPSVFGALDPNGPKLYSQPITGQNPEVPEGVKASQVMGRQIFGAKGGVTALPALAELVQAGKFKLPVKVEVIGKGFDALDGGLTRLMRGTSGTKFVVAV